MNSGWPRWRAARLIAVGAGAVAFTVVVAGPALAHAELVVASPAPGTGLPQAPAAVVLRFDEPLNLRLSRIVVSDARGREVDAGPTEAVVGDALAMQRRLGVVPPGVDTVRWTSVAADDGHVLHGSYEFGVGEAPPGGASVAAGPAATEGWAGLAGRWLGLLGLLCWAGLPVVGWVARRAGMPARTLAVLTVAAPLAAGTGFTVAALAMAQVAGGHVGAVGALLTGSASGRWQLVTLAAAAAAAVLAVLAAVGRAGAGWLVAVLALTGLVAEAAGGHAAAAPHPLLAVGLLTLHLLAVSLWVAAIVAAVSYGRAAAALLAALTPVAVPAAVVVAATGIGNAAVQLSRLGQLASTGYGRALLAKAAALMAMAGLGATHYWLRRRAIPAPAGVLVEARGELVAAVTAVAVASVLVGYPDPPRAAAVAAQQAASASPLARLDTGPAIAVAAASGPFVVGWSLSPPRPGRVRVDVTVAGAQPGDGLREAKVTAQQVGSATVARSVLRACGFGCFTGYLALPRRGSWRVTVSLRSNRGDATAARIVPLPAPDGRAELADMLAAMNRLRSLVMVETLRGSASSPAVITRYQFRAPGAMAWTIDGGGRMVTVGPVSYSRDRPDAEWQRYPSGISFSWPTAFYRSSLEPASAVRLLRDDGRFVQLAFARPDIAAWFTLDIDSRTHVLRAMQMLAAGHLMDDHVTGVNVPVTIRLPGPG